MKFAIHTFGCKVNIYESEFVINLMQDNGYNLVDFNEDADVYIINTCTVTNEADKKDRKLINSTRNNHKDAILIVMGCYSQLNKDN
jgi:threonylcarbamoyladenosine tRNA methylthiotransferase MtaB